MKETVTKWSVTRYCGPHRSEFSVMRRVITSDGEWVQWARTPRRSVRKFTSESRAQKLADQLNAES